MKTSLRYFGATFTSVLLLLVTACGSSSNSVTNESGANFPTNTIEIIVPWSAGGSSDLTARALAEAMNDTIDQNVVVINKEGAGGTIATAEVAARQPDSHTILFNANGVFSTQPQLTDVTYSLNDFRPVSGLTVEPIVLLVNAESDWETIEDLSNETERITYGHSGTGGLPDLAQVSFFNQSGVEAESVAYDGQNLAVTALLGGHVDTVAAHPGDTMQYVESGALKVLGVFSSERMEDYPEVPTFEENGYPIDMSVWKFLLVSQSIPVDQFEELTNIVNKALEHPSYKSSLETANLTADELSGEEVLEKLERDIAEHKELIESGDY